MASNRAKVIGIVAGIASTRGKSNDVKHTLGSSNNIMISTCPDSSDGRALERQSEGRGFKSRSELKFFDALVWRLHVRFPCGYVQNGLYLT